jgi:hypothetical protein
MQRGGCCAQRLHRGLQREIVCHVQIIDDGMITTPAPGCPSQNQAHTTYGHIRDARERVSGACDAAERYLLLTGHRKARPHGPRRASMTSALFSPVAAGQAQKTLLKCLAGHGPSGAVTS